MAGNMAMFRLPLVVFFLLALVFSCSSLGATRQQEQSVSSMNTVDRGVSERSSHVSDRSNQPESSELVSPVNYFPARHTFIQNNLSDPYDSVIKVGTKSRYVTNKDQHKIEIHQNLKIPSLLGRRERKVPKLSRAKWRKQKVSKRTSNFISTPTIQRVFPLDLKHTNKATTQTKIREQNGLSTDLNQSFQKVGHRREIPTRNAPFLDVNHGELFINTPNRSSHHHYGKTAYHTENISEADTKPQLHLRWHRSITPGRRRFKPPGAAAGRNCPLACHCEYRPDKAVNVVNCSSRELTDIPQLPRTSREVYLQNNKIKSIPCTKFKDLRELRVLDLSKNRIDVLQICSFANLTSLNYLWISQSTLQSLPVGLFDSLHYLIELDISQNKIDHLDPQLFTKMGLLKSLNLNTNRLTNIKNDTFQGLKSLESLSLQGNSLRYLPGTFETRAFQGLTSLESLHLEGNQPDLPDNFTYPDQALAHVPTLQRIWLDGYPRPLGPGFASLVHLTHLSFAGVDGGTCSMQSNIPPHFFNHLSTVQPLHINLTACSFHEIPPDLFKSIPTIHTLDLSLNDYLLIDGFEKASEGLQNSTLTVLNITDIVNSWVPYVAIKNTTFRFLRHTKLKKIVLEYNSLINVDPRAILDLPRTLEYISFYDNKIINAQPLLTLAVFINLRVAVISRQVHYHHPRTKNLALNNRQRFSNSRTSTSQLQGHSNNPSAQARPEADETVQHSAQSAKTGHRYMDINYTLHGRFPTGIDFCGDSLRDSKISNGWLRNDFLPIPLPSNLEELYASDILKGSYSIPTVQFFNNKVLKYLDFSFNEIECFGGPLYGVPSLQHLDLSGNSCTKLSPFFFSHMPSLKSLLLYKNVLGQSLADDVQGKSFSSLRKLEILDLSENIIEDLSELSFVNNEKLQILNISNNVLNQFNPSLVNNTKLQLLDLSSNLLVGLSHSTCTQLLAIKRINLNFTVRIAGNSKFLCDCDNLDFLRFLLDQAELFEDVATFHCTLTGGSKITYAELSQILPVLANECMSQAIFISVLIAFFLVVSSLAIYALYHFKRWQWKYLYYLSRSRLHIGSTYLTYRPVAHTFVTYDQENRKLRAMMKDVFLPRLHESGITTVLGEVDFEGGPIEPSIAGAVTNTSKTLVFLSPNIFQESYRQLEINLAIMHELHLRRPVLVPVLILREEVLTLSRHRAVETRQPAPDVNRVHNISDYRRFMDLIRDYPPEISTFLRGQVHRCLVYSGNTDQFWRELARIILEEENT